MPVVLIHSKWKTCVKWGIQKAKTETQTIIIICVKSKIKNQSLKN